MSVLKTKHIIFSILILIGTPAMTQADTTLSFWFPDIEVTDKSFKARYDSVKRRVVKVYPYAVYTQKLLLEYQKETKGLAKKSEIKKFGKSAQKKLKNDFKFIVREMYISEGKILMKLIHLETNFTVREIIELYRGKSKAGWYQFVGNMFHQNLSATYNPKDDWIIEMVLRDILAGRIKVSPNPKMMSKAEYKKIKKKRKENKKKLKDWRKEQKKKEKTEANNNKK
jgi:hypothetical protein